MKKLIIIISVLTLVSLLFAGCKENKTDTTGAVTSADSTEKTPDNGEKAKIGGEVKVGNTVTFGSYEQDNDISNGKEAIEWIVLAVKDGKALLLSKYGLDSQPFNKEYEGVTWENCTLRVWLNGDFADAAFGEAEKAIICETKLVNADNPTEGTDGGNDTTDKIFILSLDEAVNTEYGFSGDHNAEDALRQCAPTAYARSLNCLTEENTSSVYYGNCRWRLRTPSFDSDVILDVAAGGTIKLDGGLSIGGSMIAVRPALWIDLGV